ncbi:uncharacterized protein C4orf45 [Stegostoma tigrinum]|uniref:uncharacterized protein C4orf45 n=1 Tax=Stegostoma tigrinum TaxID=3053191 RepID=UPI00202B9AB7|nr:uncharacterized protein C4orf45 [Stegostoma tigrinum]
MSLRTGKNNHFPAPAELRGAVVFTGPDASRDFRPKFSDFPYYIGESQHVSAESTGNLNYLYRAAPYGSYQIPKQQYVGEIGWGWCLGLKLNKSNLLSGMQFKQGEFRQRAADKITHRYQNPWQQPPAVLDQQSLGRAFLAWPLKKFRKPGECTRPKKAAVSPFCESGIDTLYASQDGEKQDICKKEDKDPLDLEEQGFISDDI